MIITFFRFVVVNDFTKNYEVHCKVSPVQKAENKAVGIRCADHATPLSAKLVLTWPTRGGRSVSIVRSRTKASRSHTRAHSYYAISYNTI
jgi:hypothetical protein